MKREQKTRLTQAKTIVEEVIDMLNEEEDELDTETARGERRSEQIFEEIHALEHTVDVFDSLIKGEQPNTPARKPGKYVEPREPDWYHGD